MDFGNIFKLPDGTYVITYEGVPFNVTPGGEGMPDGLFDSVSQYASENPGKVTHGHPPLPPSAEIPMSESMSFLAGIMEGYRDEC